jgi:hypothetical protein
MKPALSMVFFISSSLKNETSYEDIFFVYVETSLKNETKVMSVVLVFMSSSLKNETDCSPSPSESSPSSSI